MSPRIAVLGCGYWGANHIRTLDSLGALAAVCDSDQRRAESFAQKYNVPALDREQLFTSSTIEGVVLALPPQYHTENCLRALQAGKNVLVEKPIALDIAQAEQQAAFAQSAGRILMVGHVLRFHPAFEKLLQIVENGEIGEISYIQAQRLGFGKFHKESDALWDLAPHDLSMILALAGQEPTQLFGRGSGILSAASDYAQLHMVFGKGIKADLLVSRLSPLRERRLIVVGTKAMAVFDDCQPIERKLALYPFTVSEEKRGWEGNLEAPQYISIGSELALTKELKHFIACIKEGRAPRTDAQEAIAVLKILCQALSQ